MNFIAGLKYVERFSNPFGISLVCTECDMWTIYNAFRVAGPSRTYPFTRVKLDDYEIYYSDGEMGCQTPRNSFRWM